MARPRVFNSDKELLDEALKYFKKCEKEKTIPNKAGIRLHLDISRETYNQWKTMFPDALKVIENAIEVAWVQRLAGTAATGAIFYLKNAFKEDYKDRTETDVTSAGKELNFGWEKK